MAVAPDKLGCRHLQRRPLPFLKTQRPQVGAERRNITGRHGGKEERGGQEREERGVSNEAKVTRSVIWEGSSQG